MVDSFKHRKIVDNRSSNFKLLFCMTHKGLSTPQIVFISSEPFVCRRLPSFADNLHPNGHMYASEDFINAKPDRYVVWKTCTHSRGNAKYICWCYRVGHNQCSILKRFVHRLC